MYTMKQCVLLYLCTFRSVHKSVRGGGELNACTDALVWNSDYRGHKALNNISINELRITRNFYNKPLNLAKIDSMLLTN